MAYQMGSIVTSFPATPPQVFTDEKGCSLLGESPWEGDSDVSQLNRVR